MKVQYQGKISQVFATATRSEGDEIHLIQSKEGGGFTVRHQSEKGYGMQLYQDMRLFDDFLLMSPRAYRNYRWVFDHEIFILPENNRSSVSLLSDSYEKETG